MRKLGRYCCALPLLLVTAVTVAAPSCRPNLGERDSLITRTEVLAVRGDPPEAVPNELVHYSLLVATPSGPVVTPLASWAYCATPKLLTENGATSVACLSSGSKTFAEGYPAIDAYLPENVCALFGPEVTSAELRPRDPDITGGFYQPVRVTVFGDDGTAPVAFGLERAACKAANISADVATDLAKRYVTNKNPELIAPVVALSSSDGTTPIALDAIPRGAHVIFRAAWSSASAEPFPVFDLASRTVVDHRESLRVSWYATAGTFDNDRTGRAEEELETFTDNGWTAPDEARTTHLFVVLRDSRGGVAFATYDLVTR